MEPEGGDGERASRRRENDAVRKRQIRRAARGSRARGRDTRVRTGIFFCVTTHTLSLPRTPMDVIPTDFIALNAYSVTHGEGETGRQRVGGLCTRAGRPDPTEARARQPGRGDAPTWYSRPSGLKMVMWRSYPAPLPRDILVGGVDRARATCDALLGGRVPFKKVTPLLERKAGFERRADRVYRSIGQEKKSIGSFTFNAHALK